MPEPSVKECACTALVCRLKKVLPQQRYGAIDDFGRAEFFEDNLVSSLEPDQVEELKRQLEQGDGGELSPDPRGHRPSGHSAYSSAALAFNAFGRWLGREEQLVIDGASGFNERLRVEAKQPIFKGGRAPNLDCLAVGPDVAVGVESKLTEPLAPHSRRKWSDAYGRASCQRLLTGGWLQTLNDARARTYAPKYLDADQLLKHALGLSKQHPDRERHLVYVYWEPTDGDQFEIVRDHRAEVEDFRDRVRDASPTFHALTYTELWSEWEGIPQLAGHLVELRKRYELRLD